MAVASFCFHAELNYFLPRDKKQVIITHSFSEKASIKDMIEALGVPHPEVDCIEVNAKFVDFSYIVQDGDTINVYPISARFDITPSVSVRPKPLSVIRFVLDIHLGKLATSLRLLGFDTLYRNNYNDEELAEISSSQSRILLTRDKGLLMRSLVTHGYYVRSTNPQQQIVEVLQRFDLFKVVSPFKRCLRCNGLLTPVAKESVIDELPESVRSPLAAPQGASRSVFAGESQYHEFHRCQNCAQIFWQGAHYQRLQQFIEQVLDSKSSDSRSENY